MKQTNLNDVFKNAVQLVDHFAQSKKVCIKRVFEDLEEIDAPILDSLMSDGQRLQQIFVNFLSNAIKFTKSHSQVTIRTTVLDTQAIGANSARHLLDMLSQNSDLSN